MLLDISYLAALSAWFCAYHGYSLPRKYTWYLFFISFKAGWAKVGRRKSAQSGGGLGGPVPPFQSTDLKNIKQWIHHIKYFLT